ncbi:MAG TPA: hypothetical protein VND54_04985 [Candidatus Saccharimonadales bacterium]|nr:hypothetical protein [Candidatus Saccharimonadales bacterium]
MIVKRIGYVGTRTEHLVRVSGIEGWTPPVRCPDNANPGRADG